MYKNVLKTVILRVQNVILRVQKTLENARTRLLTFGKNRYLDIELKKRQLPIIQKEIDKASLELRKEITEIGIVELQWKQWD